MRISNILRQSEVRMTLSKHLTFKNLLLVTTLLASPLAVMAPTPAAAQAEIGISVQVAPPALPIYSQPPLPSLGYIWTPGYWQWAQQGGYYWVPGTWIMPPTVGYLWTPPYWGWSDGGYLFHAGYWGPHVGYYGGVNYGYGYGGVGYQGGRWEGNTFRYNQTANNFGSVRVANAYAQRVAVVNNTTVSYAGGARGLKTQPTAAEGVAAHDQHVPATAEQTRHIAAAGAIPALAASHNKGRPAIAATSHPGQFTGRGVVRPLAAGARAPAAAHTAPVHNAAAMARPAQRTPAVHNAAATARPVARTPAVHNAAASPQAPARKPTAEPAKDEEPKR
jgi:hypothetical protein